MAQVYLVVDSGVSDLSLPASSTLSLASSTSSHASTSTAATSLFDDGSVTSSGATTPTVSPSRAQSKDRIVPVPSTPNPATGCQRRSWFCAPPLLSNLAKAACSILENVVHVHGVHTPEAGDAALESLLPFKRARILRPGTKAPTSSTGRTRKGQAPHSLVTNLPRILTDIRIVPDMDRLPTICVTPTEETFSLPFEDEEPKNKCASHSLKVPRRASTRKRRIKSEKEAYLDMWTYRNRRQQTSLRWKTIAISEVNGDVVMKSAVIPAMDGTLANLETKSRLNRWVPCRMCGTVGSDYPLDRQGRTFCSRKCRKAFRERATAAVALR